MSKNWNTYKLGEISQIVGGGTPSTLVEDYWNGNIPWLTPRDLTNYNFKFIAEGERNITEEGLKNSSAKLLPPGTVLLTSRAPIGYLAIAESEVSTNQGFKNFIVDETKVDNEFLYYLLNNNVEYLKSLGTGTTFGEVSATALRNIEFNFPDLNIQKAIASILSSLDEKIELNLQMNNTLETIAEQIYKEWFIKFKGFDGDLENHLPKGWRVGKIGEILQLQYGKALRADTRTNGEFPVIGSSGIVGLHNQFLVTGPGIVIGRKGTIGEVIWIDENFFPIDTTFYVVDKLGVVDLYYYYFLLKQQDFKKIGSDSAVPGLNRNQAHENNIIIPAKEVINEFNNIVKPLFEKRYIVKNETNTLTQIRDSLLPKLISGKIEINA